jgi:hypothetical protein
LEHALAVLLKLFILCLIVKEEQAAVIWFRLPRIPVSPGLDLDAFKARVAGAPVYIALDRLRTMRKQGSSYG